MSLSSCTLHHFCNTPVCLKTCFQRWEEPLTVYMPFAEVPLHSACNTAPVSFERAVLFLLDCLLAWRGIDARPALGQKLAKMLSHNPTMVGTLQHHIG